MASALSTAYPNLVDLVKKQDPTGGIAKMVELLAQKNSLLDDIAFKEGNLVTGHKFSARMGLPSPMWRKMNQGIVASKSQADTFEETCGSLEGLAKIDCALADLSGNPAAFRADEDNAFFTGFGLEIARALFYENSNTNPERFMGLSPRFDGTGVSANQLVRAEAKATVAVSQTLNSVWLVGWSPDTVFGIFPKGSVAGFKSEDLGKQLVKDAAGNEYTAYVTHHKWQVGLAVQDYRYVSRLVNIDPARYKADASSGPDIGLAMQDQIAQIFETDSVTPVFYMNRATFSMFNKQLLKRSQNFLEYIERGGRRVPHYLGIPIRISDALVPEFSI